MLCIPGARDREGAGTSAACRAPSAQHCEVDAKFRVPGLGRWEKGLGLRSKMRGSGFGAIVGLQYLVFWT